MHLHTSSKNTQKRAVYLLYLEKIKYPSKLNMTLGFPMVSFLKFLQDRKT